VFLLPRSLASSQDQLAESLLEFIKKTVNVKCKLVSSNILLYKNDDIDN